MLCETKCQGLWLSKIITNILHNNIGNQHQRYISPVHVPLTDCTFDTWSVGKNQKSWQYLFFFSSPDYFRANISRPNYCSNKCFSFLRFQILNPKYILYKNSLYSIQSPNTQLMGSTWSTATGHIHILLSNLYPLFSKCLYFKSILDPVPYQDKR